jgi:HK97 family phage portal protein
MGPTIAGQTVTAESAMRVGTVFGCVRVISDQVSTLPLHLKRRVGEDVREDASDDPLWGVLRRRPNKWQTPSQFRNMLQAQKLLRGDGFALIVRSRGRVTDLIPLDTTRMTVKQRDDLSIEYKYTRKQGGQVILAQAEVFHLAGLTLNGVNGVSPITHARESIGMSMAQDTYGASTFKNGARISNVLSHPHKLGIEGQNNLRASLSAFRSGGEMEGQDLILEEGMEVKPMAMTSADAQWIESRKLTRSDIAMFFGVPPHMLGDTEKSTSWGSGIEQQTIGFISYTLEAHLTAWEETINRDLIGPDKEEMYARFNRGALVRGDIKTRFGAYAVALQWGWMSPDEIRALEDLNPREDGAGGKFYDPPNTAGGEKGSEREPPEST